MKAFLAPMASVVIAVAAVLLQYPYARWPGFHSWQYATALASLGLVVAGYGWTFQRNRTGRTGPLVAFACVGGLIVVLAGLASALLGPDTQTVAAGPGSVVPLPDLGAAAAFPAAGAQTIAQPQPIQLRGRDRSIEELWPHARRIAGSFELENDPQAAAFIRVTDRRGRHMTVTQPANASFLSPVLLFGGQIVLQGKTVRSDSFAVPALQRQVKAVYLPAGMLSGPREHGALGAKDTVLFILDDGSGRPIPGGIGLSPGGAGVPLGEVILYPSLGAYPQLIVSSVPAPAAVALGTVLALASFALGLFPPLRRSLGVSPA